MDMAVDELGLKKENLVKHIIGEIAVSNEPGKTIKKWRNVFRVSQKQLAGALGLTSSVVSDYESGRRKSPGVVFLKRYVEALIKIDETLGGETVRGFVQTGESNLVSSAIADIREFEKGVSVSLFCERIGASVIGRDVPRDGLIYGYTVIDSVKAITELPFAELIKLYGVTTQRALIFTNITSGKGSMIAIKVANLRPALVVLHDITHDNISDVARSIARVEAIPLALCENKKIEDIVSALDSI